MPLALSDFARDYAAWGSEATTLGGAFQSAALVAAIAGPDGIKRERVRLVYDSELALRFPDSREITFPTTGGRLALASEIGAGIASTDELPEGSTNLYFTNARADARIALASINDLSDVAGVSAITGEIGSGAIVRAAAPTLTGAVVINTTGSLNITGSSTGTLRLAEWATGGGAYFAAGFAGSVAAGAANLYSSPGDTNFYLNAPTSREIRFRINDATQMALAAGSLDPATAGSTSLGRAGLGWNGLYLDSSSTANSIAIVGGAAGSNITLTTPTSTGTLALTSDIAATVTQAFVNALNVDADTLDGLDSTDFALVGHNHTGVYQPLDTQLTDLAGLSYASNALKVVRVNAAETGWELATPGAGYTDEEAQDAVGAMVNGTLVYTDGTPELGVDPTLAITSLTLSSLTAGRVPIVSTAGLLADDAGLLYDATTDQLTSGIFKQGVNNAGGFYGAPTSGTNDYRLFVNSSNEWELRQNVGGVVTATYLFGGTALYPSGLEALGNVNNGWESLFLEEPGGGDTAQIIAPALGSDIVLTTPAATGTLARTDGDNIGATTPATGKFTTLQRRGGTGTGYAGVSGTLHVDTTAVGNVGAGTDDLMTYTLPANTLATNGDWVRITAAFVTAANGNTKSIAISVGGTSIWAQGPIAFNDARFAVGITIVRTGSSTQMYSYHADSSSALFTASGRANAATMTMTDTAGIVIKGTGNSNISEVTDDIRQTLMLIEYGSLQ